MENEKQLRDEQVKRKEAEDKLFALVQKTRQARGGDNAPGGNSEFELLELANSEIKKKDLEVKTLKNKVEIYEGKNLDRKNP